MSAYHHGENDRSRQRFDDPEQNQAAELGDGEQVNLPQRDVSQIDKIWLVLRRHTDKFQTVEELKDEEKGTQVERKVEKKMNQSEQS